MFLEKVGSDPCLVLDGTVTDTEAGRVELKQTFSYTDLKEALKTKCVSIRIVFTPLITAIGYVTLTYDADATEIPPSNDTFTVTIAGGTGSQTIQFLSDDSIHWVGTILTDD